MSTNGSKNDARREKFSTVESAWGPAPRPGDSSGEVNPSGGWPTGTEVENPRH